ncbi:uncharacterized protein LOC110650994 isoform X2 [Hevea brasiliensis]|nr:uncharacterized protein LOC110650994 isoform X2 [Hevea brasiliensis]
MGDQKSRREQRKEARQAKAQQKHQSWMEHQKLQNHKGAQQAKRTFGGSRHVNRSKSSFTQNLREGEGRQQDTNHETNQSTEKMNVRKKMKVKSESLSHDCSTTSKKESKGLKRNLKTKFEEFIEMDMKNADVLAQEDLVMERRLAKKLKVKEGKLRGMDDEINLLLSGIPSVHESFDEVPLGKEFPIEKIDNGTLDKKRKKQKSLDDFSGNEIAADIMGGVCKSEETSDVEMGLEESAKTTSHKKDRKRKKKNKNQGSSVAGVATNSEIAGDIMDGVSEPEENSGAELGGEEGVTKISSLKKCRKRKKSKENEAGNIVGDTSNGVSTKAEAHEADVALQEAPTIAPTPGSSVKYVAPHLISRIGNESEEHTQIRRRVRGLLNRLSESNVESVTGQMATIFNSVSRNISSQIISDEVLAACSGGPRGNEQYAAVFAAFVAGMACSVGMDFSAKLIASLAKCFEDEYLKEDNLSLRNLTLLLSYLCTFGVCSSDLIYDFLIMLSKRLTEIDVSTILTVLQCCGMKIRADDPTAMKNFIQSVQSRVNELKSSPGEDQAKMIGKRMEFMLETICDIKNNKKRPKDDSAQNTRIKKWLQKLRVQEILLRGLKWSRLLDPDKKGQWWLSGDTAITVDDVEEVASTIDKEVVEAQKMLRLAALQRMNTDARKAIFCILMSGEDYIDAFEKLLRLDLPGKQDREIIRVLVECCLQEKVFNKYYTVLASKLCGHDKNHKYTLQYCLWDHFKELEFMPLLRSMHLAKFAAEMVASFTLSLSVLKSVELSDAGWLTSKRIMHFRMLFEALFEYPDSVVWNAFTRVAIDPQLETLRNGIEFFIREYVVKTNNAIVKKFKIVKKALNNVEGVLM